MITPIKKNVEFIILMTQNDERLLYAYILFNGFIYFNNKEKLDLYR